MNLRKLLLTRFSMAILVFALLLSACELPAPGGSKPTPPSPEALYTIAAQTAEAMRSQRFAQTPTLAPQQLIETVANPTATATEAPAAGITPSPAATDPGQAAPPAASGDRAEFVADVTVPDGTVFAPSETFQKTWRIANTGQTTWTTDYALVFVDGDLLGAEGIIPLEEEVAPGEQIDITVEMTAPTADGTYTSYWKMRNAASRSFGFGSNGTEAIWTKIVVGGAAAAAETTTTVTPAAGQALSGIDLSIDNTDVVASCPHTFLITAQLTLEKPASLTYNLEVGNDSGATIKVWTPITQNLVAGIHPVVYELTIGEDTAGWARLRVTDPVQMLSNQVNFTLTCG